jgi:hypothetical protein
VAVLGLAVVDPPAAWQPAQFFALGVACAAGGPMVATRSAAEMPVASTATFGMLAFFSL